MDEKETYGKAEVTCPYCGYEEGDSWKISSDDGIRECMDYKKCGKRFRFQRIVDVTYDTQQIED